MRSYYDPLQQQTLASDMLRLPCGTARVTDLLPPPPASTHIQQEVNQSYYDQFFKPNMELQGYKSVFKRRTGEEKRDGCAIFYSAEKFELKKTLPVDFNRGVDILDRDNVALLIMLQPKKVGVHCR